MLRLVKDLTDKELLDLTGVELHYLKNGKIYKDYVNSVARGFLYTNGGDVLIKYDDEINSSGVYVIKYFLNDKDPMITINIKAESNRAAYEWAEQNILNNATYYNAKIFCIRKKEEEKK